jgi:methionyl-tRNA formyltransferase
MRVAFFGLPLAALLLARDGVEIALAAISRPRAIGTRRLERLIGPERVAAQREALQPEFTERVRAAAPDLLVSWFWTKRLPRALLDIPPLGALGVHPSLLPRHRGPDPTFWAIESGDAVTGVTAHRLDETYDTGAILGQRELAIDPTWSAWTLARALDRPSLALLREVVGAFSRGRPPPEAPQREELATFAPEPDDEQLEISWRTESARIARRIRAASPWPGAYTRIGDQVVTLTEARVAATFPRALAPGEGAVGADGVAVVRTLDGAIALLAGRDEEDASLDARGLAALVLAAR